jgi:hypothetical protein
MKFVKEATHEIEIMKKERQCNPYIYIYIYIYYIIRCIPEEKAPIKSNNGKILFCNKVATTTHAPTTTVRRIASLILF